MFLNNENSNPPEKNIRAKVSDQVSFPEGVRHGTSFKVSENVFNTLNRNR